MREMTTAEFAKANLGALSEPIQVRRYTKVVGRYYPDGFEPSAATTEALNLALDASIVEISAQKKLEELEDEIKRLKKELATRSPLPEAWQARPAALVDAVATKTTAKRSEDPFANLPEQDRDFFERKLGKRK